MNISLAVAASLSFIAGPLHSLLGEKLIFSRLQAEQLPGVGGNSLFTKQILRMFWHLVSLCWWGFAVVLVILSTLPELEMWTKWIAATLALTFLASSALALVVTRARHFSWIILLAITVAIGLGIVQ